MPAETWVRRTFLTLTNIAAYNPGLLALRPLARPRFRNPLPRAINIRQMTSNSKIANPWNYPQARREESIGDIYPGDVKVPDPYRWLEDPDSRETEDFVDAQNVISSKYFGSFEDKKALRSAIEDVYSYERFTSPRETGNGYWYWSYNPALLNQSQIWRSKSFDRSDPELFFDPNLLSSDGTVSLGTMAFSKNGKLLAYALSESGSDNQTIYVKESKETDTLKKLDDKILYVKFSSISWSKDNLGFVYQRYPEKDNTGRGTAADINPRLCYHKIGTPQSSDIELHKDADHPHWMFGGEISDDGKYLIITTSQGTEHTSKLTIAELGDDLAVVTDLKKVVVVDDFHAAFDYITNYGTTLVFQTNENAPNGKVVTLDFKNIAAGFKDLIPESKDVLESVVPFDNSKLICTYTHDVKGEVSIYDGTTGSFISKLPLPIGLSVYGAVCNYDSTDGFFVAAGSFTSPMTLYRYDNKTSKLSMYRDTRVKGIDPSEYETEQVFYPSKDGTKIPMFIVGRKSLPKDGSTPLLQYGYGGFEISITPSYSSLFMSLMMHFDFRIAVANIRGGGEYGQAWWKAAIKMHRQNAYDDFQYGAKFLTENKYSSPPKQGIYGGSNGGLLVGVCINQAPQLFGAAVASVGVMDMLRFDQFTIGRAWTSDYGSPHESVEMFNYIKSYSPLHNVDSEKEYPATLLLTGDHDDRVSPLHTLKFTAELQYRKPENRAPLILRVDKKAGHGAGKPTSKKIDETSDQIAFLSLALGAKFHE